jgi:hypothetical protein
MEDKYYTPSIEEFRIGFEYEHQADVTVGGVKLPPDHPDSWFEKTFDLEDSNLDEILIKIGLGVIRVKILDKEDIESEGFEKIGDQFESIKTYFGIGTGDDKKLCICIDDERHSADIWFRSNRGDMFTKFEGTIKNKSELKRILKMIGV